MTTFNQFNLQTYILTTLGSQKIQTTTPIQEKLIPSALKGRDILGIAPAGTGKTLAYLIPLLSAIDVSSSTVQGLILSPTRELAAQILTVLQSFQKEEPRLEIQLITGGIDKERMKERGVPHILIATPGRFKDIFIQDPNYSLRTIKRVVLDEVDMIVDNGFIDSLKEIMSVVAKQHQTIAVSSTLSQDHEKAIRTLLINPLFFDVTKDAAQSQRFSHIALPLKHLSKETALMQLLPIINPFVCFIFASQISTVNRVFQTLKESNYSVIALHGDMEDSERRSIIKRIFNHEFTYIVASDIAARGLDLEGVTHVIHLDFPRDLDFYFHRSGRTGRLGGSDGKVYAFYADADQNVMKKLQERGIQWQFQVIKQGQMGPDGDTKKRQKRLPDELKKEIKKVIRKHKNGQVKPGYKKKIAKEIDKLRRKHRREVIRKDIKRQIKERAMEKSKSEKGEI